MGAPRNAYRLLKAVLLVITLGCIAGMLLAGLATHKRREEIKEHRIEEAVSVLSYNGLFNTTYILLNHRAPKFAEFCGIDKTTIIQTWDDLEYYDSWALSIIEARTGKEFSTKAAGEYRAALEASQNQILREWHAKTQSERDQLCLNLNGYVLIEKARANGPFTRPIRMRYEWLDRLVSGNVRE
ncbi:MAG: hypothetical protein KBA75_10295 [Alphaproteobacteria bacterium]|nr:hypothetical protein [Alphaproteobacteria bacterium]